MKEINAEEIKDNPFKLIGKDWMLITAEKDGRVNMMTASWGGVGILWGKNVATVYIRDSRFTKGFVDDGDHFSLCVLPEDYRKALGYSGKASGRDEDKVAGSGLTVEHEASSLPRKWMQKTLQTSPWFLSSMQTKTGIQCMLAKLKRF